MRGARDPSAQTCAPCGKSYLGSGGDPCPRCGGWGKLALLDDECPHDNADHLMPGEWRNRNDVPVEIVSFEQFRCLDCGAWLSLGPSNDDVPSDELAFAVVAVDIVRLSRRGCEFDRVAALFAAGSGV